MEAVDQHNQYINEQLALAGYLVFVTHLGDCQKIGCRFVSEPYLSPIPGFVNWRTVGPATLEEFNKQTEVLRKYNMEPADLDKHITLWKVVPVLQGEECYEAEFEEWASSIDLAWRNCGWRQLAYKAFCTGINLGRQIHQYRYYGRFS